MVDNDSNGHPYCDEHKAGEGILCRAVRDIKEYSEKMEKTQSSIHNRVDAVELNLGQKIDASDRSATITHGEMYNVMREMEKSKMSNKTFWSIAAVLGVMFVAGFTAQNIQINNTRKDQIVASTNHTAAMTKNSDKVGKKLDIVVKDVGTIKIDMEKIKGNVKTLASDFNNYKKAHQREHLIITTPKAWGKE